MLETINLKLKTPKEDYKQRWPILRDHLYDLQKACWEAGIPSIILFEGWDASGKGTTINALTQRLDPRGFKLYPIQAPRTQELHMPWLWRFWLKVPNYGEMAIFDRSWYGRVLVERVEQITPVEEWRTAFADIVNFERALIDDGYILIKFFLHISKKEQKKRFQKLESDPLESWHVQAEDWDHHRKYDKYLQSIEEMLERTETEWGPWTIVEATDKRWSRIKVIETIIQRLEAALRAKGLPIPIQPEAGVNADEPAENTDDLGDETQTPLFAISGQESLPVKRGRGRPRKNPLPEAVLSEGGEQAAAGEAQVKRGRGRPRKNPIESAEAVPAAEKKPRGRPRKNPLPEAVLAEDGEQAAAGEVQVKRGRGRPRKNPLETAEAVPAAEKKPRGRPRKNPLPEAVMAEGGEQAAAGEAQVKRGRGRPRKNPLETAEAVPAAEKKPRGRPRKNPLPEAVLAEGGEQAAAGEAQVKRGRGRPRKNPLETAEAVPAAEKKPRGRPRKNPLPEAVLVEGGEQSAAGEVQVKRGRGRPRKNPIESAEAVPAAEKKPRGRPRKNPLPEAVLTEVGEQAAAGEAQVKRGRGRPRKNPIESAEAVPAAEKKPRGRPRKNPIVNPPAALEGELIEEQQPEGEPQS